MDTTNQTCESNNTSTRFYIYAAVRARNECAKYLRPLHGCTPSSPCSTNVFEFGQRVLSKPFHRIFLQFFFSSSRSITIH